MKRSCCFCKIARLLLFHAAVLSACIAYALLVGCPLRRVFSVECPMCGMTRAHLALLRGDFKGAAAYHPLYFLGIPFVLALAHLRIFPKSVKAIASAFALLCGAAFVFRYLFP